jgi:hypothetical protein
MEMEVFFREEIWPRGSTMTSGKNGRPPEKGWNHGGCWSSEKEDELQRNFSRISLIPERLHSQNELMPSFTDDKRSGGMTNDIRKK